MSTENDLKWTAHMREHELIALALDTAFETAETERALHAVAHTSEHEAHVREHGAASELLNTRAESYRVDRELRASAHAKEHELEGEARDKAELNVGRRLDGMNEVRGQLRDQAATFARNDQLTSLTDRVIAIEKLDIKGEGRSIGQGAVIAVIVTAIGVSATVVSMVIVIANFATQHTP